MSILKIVLVFYVAYTCIKGQANNLFILYEIPLNQAISLIGDIIIDTGLRISLCYLVVGLADYIYQRHRFNEDMKMTKQEVKDEYKNTEGDPQIKGQQRQRMREASQRRMMQDVPKADVVITNPTHIAVAIRYDAEIENAPTVVAKVRIIWRQRSKKPPRKTVWRSWKTNRLPERFMRRSRWESRFHRSCIRQWQRSLRWFTVKDK